MMKKRILTIGAVLCLLIACIPLSAQAAATDIVILYENDAHCAVNGYAKLSAMKAELQESGAHVGVVSAGDFVQGGSLGAISQGEYIVNIMNMVGYDAVALGNHEFDYRLEQLFSLVEIMDTKPICSNFTKVNETAAVFAPFTIVSYGDTEVAYVGITTPDTLTSSAPSQFLNSDGSYAYSFHSTDLYAVVQQSVDAAVAAGAEYVVALSHLGTEYVNEAWSAQALVANTTDIDAVIDGHSHSVVPCLTVNNKNGVAVPVTSTGTQFAHIGKLTIEADGDIVPSLISVDGYEKTDEAITAYIAQINEEYAELGERKIGESKVDLMINDADGTRLVRRQETNLGDFCADAFRVVTGADIGVVNGGGIRADMAAGDVTFNDILNVFPFNNTVCVAEVTGQQLVDLLELGVMMYPEENGSFQHVSGLRFRLDDTVASAVKLDENAVFVSVDGAYRVKDVTVWDAATGTYVPVELEKTYTLASHNHLLKDYGGGASMLSGAKLVADSGMLDVELLEIYITEYLGGVIGEEYAVPQGRIVIGEASETTTTVTRTTVTQTASPQTGDAHTMNVLCCAAIAMVAVTAVMLRRKQKSVK